jgi:spermidine synthase
VPRVCRLLDVHTGLCSVHEVRPVQCGVYPFRVDALRSEEDWREESRLCEGTREVDSEVVSARVLQSTLTASLLHEFALQDESSPVGRAVSSGDSPLTYTSWSEMLDEQVNDDQRESAVHEFIVQRGRVLLDRSACGAVKVFESVHSPSHMRRYMEFASSTEFEQTAVLRARVSAGATPGGVTALSATTQHALELHRLLSPVHDALLASVSGVIAPLPSDHTAVRESESHSEISESHSEDSIHRNAHHDDASETTLTAAAPLPQQQQHTVYVLGGGGCALPSAGVRFHSTARFVTAEMSETVADMARRHFLGARVPPNFELRVCDGIDMVRSAPRSSLSALLVDVASLDHHRQQTASSSPWLRSVAVPPPAFLTEEFAAQARRALSADGLLAMNLCLGESTTAGESVGGGEGESTTTERTASGSTPCESAGEGSESLLLRVIRDRLAPLWHRNGFPLVSVVPIYAPLQFVLVASASNQFDWSDCWREYAQRTDNQRALDRCVEFRASGRL